MQFVRLSAENFKSFERADIELSNNGFVKIEGVNNTDDFSKSVGSGKSTVADMLSYALTGETVAGSSSISDVKNMYTSGKCWVRADFVDGEKEYSIIRGEDGLTFIEDGVDISKHLKRDTQQEILRRFPYFTPTFLGATVIIGQNMPNSFTNNKPSARKQILENLTNSSFMIEEIKSMLATVKDRWQTSLSEIGSKICGLQSRLSAVQGDIALYEERLAGLRSADVLREELGFAVALVSEQESVCESRRSALASIEAQQVGLREECDSVRSDLDFAKQAHYSDVMSSVEELVSEKERMADSLVEAKSELSDATLLFSKLSKEYVELRSAPTVCPTCKQPLPASRESDLPKLADDVDAAALKKRDLEFLVSSLTSGLSELSGRISDIRASVSSNEVIDSLSKKLGDKQAQLRELSSAVESARSTFAAEDKKLADLRKRESDLRVQLEVSDSLRSDYEEHLVRLRAELSASEEDLDRLCKDKEGVSSRLAVLNQVISFAQRDFRTLLLKQIIGRLDIYAKSFCSQMLGTSDISFVDDGNNIQVSFCGRDFSVLSGGESLIVKLCITLALKKTLEDVVGFTTNIMFFDECTDSADSDVAAKIIDLISSLNLSSTYFITHHADYYLPVDKVWTVVKSDNISKILFN